MNKIERRFHVLDAIARLEPEAHTDAIRNFLAEHDGLPITPLNLLVDLDRLVKAGVVVRRARVVPGAARPRSFWETMGPVLVSAPAEPHLFDRAFAVAA